MVHAMAVLVVDRLVVLVAVRDVVGNPDLGLAALLHHHAYRL